ncbi:MAG: hypothetical protein ACT4OK_12020 [Gemmobacter sp.]
MPDPRPGDIWRYPYLWDRQARQGETEGRKDRPAAIVAAVHDAQGTLYLALLAITTKPPGEGRIALPIPQTEAHRSFGDTYENLRHISLPRYDSRHAANGIE